MTEITATIKNAVLWGESISGEIHGDTRGRWPDGTQIRTSKIVKRLPDDIFVTLNSVYKVELLK